MSHVLENLKNKVTGIGSMPHKDVSAACRYILDKCPDLPFWPQLARLDPRENMLIQYSENLPCLIADLERNGSYYNTACSKDEELLKFYERFTEKDIEYFKISPAYAAGFYKMLELSRNSPAKFLKGQVVGPLTFLSSVQGPDNRALLYDEMLSDAIIKALAMKAVWQAKQIRAINKSAVIFFDEPYLASFGSAFCNLTNEQVTKVFNDLAAEVKNEADVLVGVHCCGNSDWEMMLAANIDILNFDFFGFGKYFTLYPEAIKKFLQRGGIIAWGAIPTSEYTCACTVASLLERFNHALAELEKKGIDKKNLLSRSIFTPSCGMATLDEKTAEKILGLASEFARTKF